MTKRTNLYLLLLSVVVMVQGFALLAQVTPAAARPPLGISMDDGTVSAPAYNFSDDTDTGIYRVGTNNLGVAAGGTLAMDWNATSTDANSLPIVNIGAAGTDFSATGGLTLADALVVSSGGITGALNTAAQPNITSVGTLASATITNLTTTSVTGTLQTAAQPNVTSVGTQTNLTASGTITATTSLVLGTDSFTGAVKYGVEATYTSAAAITHGFTVTPTACLMFPSRDVTETVTIGATTFSSDRATQANPVYWACGK